MINSRPVKYEQSSITFKDLVKDLNFIKVIYNHEKIYNDICATETKEHLDQVMQEYGDKKVYGMNITIVQGHHCILIVNGEK